MKFQLIILSFIVLGSNKLLLANGPRKTGSVSDQFFRLIHGISMHQIQIVRLSQSMLLLNVIPMTRHCVQCLLQK